MNFMVAWRSAVFSSAMPDPARDRRAKAGAANPMIIRSVLMGTVPFGKVGRRGAPDIGNFEMVPRRTTGRDARYFHGRPPALECLGIEPVNGSSNTGSRRNLDRARDRSLRSCEKID